MYMYTYTYLISETFTNELHYTLESRSLYIDIKNNNSDRGIKKNLNDS